MAGAPPKPGKDAGADVCVGIAPKPPSMLAEVAVVVFAPVPKPPKAGGALVPVEAGVAPKPPKLGVGAGAAVEDPKAVPNPAGVAEFADVIVPEPPKPAGAAAGVAVGAPMLPKPVDAAGAAVFIPNAKPPGVVEVAGAGMAVVVDPKPPNGEDAGLVAPKPLPKAGAAGAAVGVVVNPANPAGADVVAGVVDCAVPNATFPVCGLTVALAMLKGWATPTGAVVVADGAPKEKGWEAAVAAGA